MGREPAELRHSLGCAFAQGQRGCARGVGWGSPAAPCVRGRRLSARPGARPDRVWGLCVGIEKEEGLPRAGLGILVLDAFPFVEMAFKFPGVGFFASCALRMECGFGKEGACQLEGQSGWWW